MVTNLKRRLLIGFSIIIGSIVIFTIVLYFLAGNLSAQAQKASVNQGLLDQQTDALTALASLKEQAPEAATYQTSIDQLVSTQDGLIGFGEWLNNAASANQVSVSFSFGNTVSQPSENALGKIAFSFVVTGGLEQITAFLQDIESKAPGFLLQITSFDAVTTGTGYQLNGQGNVFFRS